MGIEASTTVLVGRWLAVGATVQADDACRRIDGLIRDGQLTKLGQTADGWSVLYVDKSDGRLWELTYPEGALHGGGPPQLAVISPDQATKSYGGNVAV
jgi:Immunity protein 27